MSERYQTDGTYIIEPDRHVPYDCKRYQGILVQTIRWLNPDGYINLGDGLDFPGISKYAKDPRKVNRVEQDVVLWSAGIDVIEAEMSRGTVLHFLCGNHEDRLRRYVLEHAGELVALMPSVPKMLGFPERNAKGRNRFFWHPLENWKSCKIGNTVLHHGFYFDKHTATNNLTRYCSHGVNFIQGHTHRTQYASNGRNFSQTLGHSSDAHQTAHAPTPSDWEKSLGILTVHRGKGSLEIYNMADDYMIVRGRKLKG